LKESVKVELYIWDKLEHMYKYWGFGLNIASDIGFPELLEHDFDIPDVE
jgi:hypothetical protein